MPLTKEQDAARRRYLEEVGLLAGHLERALITPLVYGHAPKDDIDMAIANVYRRLEAS